MGPGFRKTWGVPGPPGSEKLPGGPQAKQRTRPDRTALKSKQCNAVGTLASKNVPTVPWCLFRRSAPYWGFDEGQKDSKEPTFGSDHPHIGSNPPPPIHQGVGMGVLALMQTWKQGRPLGPLTIRTKATPQQGKRRPWTSQVPKVQKQRVNTRDTN